MQNSLGHNKREAFSPLFAQSRSYDEDFSIVFEDWSTENWGTAIGLHSIPLDKAEPLLIEDASYPLRRVMDLSALYMHVTHRVLEVKQDMAMKSLLARKPSFVRDCDLLQYDTLRALYTCNFGLMEKLLPRLQATYSSNNKKASFKLHFHNLNLFYAGKSFFLLLRLSPRGIQRDGSLARPHPVVCGY